MTDDRAPSAPCELTVLLPACNEELAIAGVISEIRAALSDLADAWEILVVDDGSTDRTGVIAADQGARIIRRIEQGGYGVAVKTGLVAARGAWIALIDADGSYSPASLPDLLKLTPDFEQINGVRNCEQGGQRWLRFAAKEVLRRLAEWISGKKIPDLNTGMKVFRRETALRYFWVIPDGFSCSTSLTLAFLCNGHPVRYVPIEYRPRHGNSKFRIVQDTAQYALTIVRMIMYFRPLRVFLPLALGLGSLAVIKGTYDVLNYRTGLADAEVILATGAVVVLALGLLADLIVARSRNVSS